MSEREELAQAISKALGEVAGIYDTSEQEDLELADAIIAAGFTKSPPQRRNKSREKRARRKALPEHRANGPYLPVGDLGGERCVTCKTPWPCAAVLPGGTHHEHEDCCK